MPAVPVSSFAERFGGHIDLTPAEEEALARLSQRERALRRGAVLVREKDPSADLFIVASGLLMSYVILDDGSRQILRFLFPGDLIGASVLAYGRASEGVASLTDSVVCPFERSEIGRLAVEHPRLSALILLVQQIEHVAMTDRLAGLGRTSAKSRVAAVLLDVRNRQRRIDLAAEDSFVLGLTQEEIGDATGLTAVHVNRMLRQLEEEGLIARENGRVRILNDQRLARGANYVDRRDGFDLGWLPAAR